MQYPLLVAALVLGSAGVVAAEPAPFVEGVAGVAIPVADEDWSDAIDPSLKLGVRGGLLGISRSELGVELGVDYTPLSNDLELGPVDVDLDRLRLLLGARFSRPVRRDLTMFFRAAVGLDRISSEVHGEILGIPFDAEEDDSGLALEAGFGLLLRLDRLYLGGQVAIPMSFHDEDDDTADDVDFDFTTVDLDLLFTIGTVFD